MGAPSIDHVAVQVPDFDRCLDFFTSVLGMEITLVDSASGEKPWKQAWVGGIQLQRMDGANAGASASSADGVDANANVSSTDGANEGTSAIGADAADAGVAASGADAGATATDAGAGPAPSMTHIGIAADNVQELLDKVYALDGVHQAPGKDRNWFVLPNGITIELLARE